MALIYHTGYVFKDDGTAVEGATVQLYQTDSTTLVTLSDGSSTSTTTNSSGYYSATVTEVSATSSYDVKITSGSSIRYRRGNDKLQLEELDIRNDTGNNQGGLLVANTTNNASNKVATFANRNTTGASNDEIYLTFELHNAAEEITEYARMTVVAKDATDASEDGEIQFDVMKAGTLTKVWTISSSTSAATSMDMNVDTFTIGTGADTDVILAFDANTSDGTITWMEDEDYFKFSDDILMNSTEKINFGDTGTFIHQSSDGVLTIESDTTVDINGAVALNGAITGATNITLSGELDAATLDISGNANIDGTLEADAITINGTAIGSIYGVVAGSSSIVTVGTITTGVWQGTAIASAYIAADAITGAKIADDAIGSEHIADDAITSALIADDAITTALIADDAITSALIADGAIVNADVNASAAIAISKTALVAGTNISLSTNTLNVDDAFLKNDADDTTSGIVTVGGIVLSEAKHVNISTPLLGTTDHTFTGFSVQMLAGGAISAFDLVCIHSTTSEIVKADASAYATARAIGIAPAAISDTATGTILLKGFIRDDTYNWTTGATLYLSETAGALTATAPTTDGAFVQAVGIALSPDVVYINPSMDVIEHA